MDELTQLAIKYETDKWGKHNYTPFYYNLLKDKKNSIKKMLEIGAGEGAGLRMWQDFFPNTLIYGGEIDPKRAFKEGRIEVYYCDQSSEESIQELLESIGYDIDFVVDDGSHVPEHQVLTCLTLMPLLKKETIYVIEDVSDVLFVSDALVDYNRELFTGNIHRYDDKLLVIRNKNG